MNEVSRTKHATAYYITRMSLFNVKGEGRKTTKSIFSFYVGDETTSHMLDRHDAAQTLKKIKKVLAKSRRPA